MAYEASALYPRGGVACRPFLDSLNPVEVADLYSTAYPRFYRRGIPLFYEFEEPDHIVTLLTGRVKVTRLSEEGREVLLTVRGPKDILGVLSVIDGAPRSATATPLEAVEGLVLRTADFLEFLERHPRVTLELLRMASWRLRDSDEKRLEFGGRDSTGRVAARIVELADRFGEPIEGAVRIDLPITQEELAGWSGCSREAVSRALQGMRALGWLETARRAIIVHDRDALCARAGERG